ncbi:hypothetical protein ADJ79_04295 [Ottowia sp. oral taxon 894]|uniref:DUF4124 domain-containing protein n=1 Tax=Ottowia sp. oral taxon 894 TaxID=1658672 RepID=UPI0006835793|nr:DUF4124 domain-containing protein [Ottowia sp. oral taxon 894]AKU66653.1 hypothetical protein ADJ79_04295 [Ottowia sp. oral taxon 894]
MKLTVRALAAASFAALAVAASLPAHAQYQWIDGSGRRVFSDQPPPPGTPQKNILKQPAARPAAPAPAADEAESSAADSTAAPAAAPQASTPQAAAPTAQDKALQEKLKKAEAEEAAKKKAEADRLAAQKAENCKRAISAKALLDSGQRIMQSDGKGGRSFMSPEQRAAETKRIEEVMRNDCN